MRILRIGFENRHMFMDFFHIHMSVLFKIMLASAHETGEKIELLNTGVSEPMALLM